MAPATTVLIACQGSNDKVVQVCGQLRNKLNPIFVCCAATTTASVTTMAPATTAAPVNAPTGALTSIIPTTCQNNNDMGVHVCG